MELSPDKLHKDIKRIKRTAMLSRIGLYFLFPIFSFLVINYYAYASEQRNFIIFLLFLIPLPVYLFIRGSITIIYEGWLITSRYSDIEIRPFMIVLMAFFPFTIFYSVFILARKLKEIVKERISISIFGFTAFLSSLFFTFGVVSFILLEYKTFNNFILGSILFVSFLAFPLFAMINITNISDIIIMLNEYEINDLKSKKE